MMMKKCMKKLAALLLAALMVLALSACGSDSKFTVDKVVMTYVPSPLNVPSILERDSSIYANAFKELGLEFEYSTLDSGADQTAALASGDIQILNAVGGSSVILAAAGGADIAIISMYSTAPKAFAMYSNDESINSPEDLRDKTIAGPKGTNLHELLVAYLATAGMTIEDVNYVSMDIPSSVAALEGGSVDVALAGGAAAYNCKAGGKHLICDGEGLIAATIVTATTRKFAEDNPEIIKVFKTMQQTIVNLINADEDGAITLTAESMGLSEDAVREMYAMYDFNPELEDEDIALIQSTEEFLYSAGMIDTHVDVASLKLD